MDGAITTTWRDARGGEPRYVKEVDDAESTVRFYQEVYDSGGRLREVH